MNVLVINSGSSSIKFQLIDMDTRTPRCKGLLERIGLADGVFTYEPAGRPKSRETRDILTHGDGIRMVLDAVCAPETGVIRSLAEIGAVGHRIVHGGEKIKKSEVMTDDVVAIVSECSRLAPLHNPPNLTGLAATRALLPDVPQVGVFDTAFHAAMPPHAYVYALDYDCYETHGIRRFGFHGTSHQYVAQRAAELLGKPPLDFNCVTCHLGNGVSLTAVRGGTSVDTTLGFGTMCGVPMGTRAGDVDPAIILHLIDNLGFSSAGVHDLLYRKSGFKGLSGRSSDMRDVETAAASGDMRSRLALGVFFHAARKYVAAMATSLGGRLDAIVFTAGIGENSPETRTEICRGLEFMGVHLDEEKNRVRGREAVVSTDASPVRVMVVPTNEELMIAIETQRVVAGTA
jgi:acetate kinase